MQQQQVCQERSSQRNDANQVIFCGMALIWKFPALPCALMKIPKGEHTALPNVWSPMSVFLDGAMRGTQTYP